jgi:cyclic pyranopterin phosphate synthase
MADLTHIDKSGAARMVDIAQKGITRRRAVASARLRTTPEVIDLIRRGAVAKGDVIAAARIAGIMAAKKTSDLIPLCHPLPLESVNIDIVSAEAWIDIRVTAETTAKTGVEMEAMAAAAVAALTIYDMCKAADRAMVIEQVRLEEKSGGKSGEWRRN